MPEVTPDKSGHLPFGEHQIYWEYHGKGDRSGGR